jgi:sterol desaturase/sphingolipid hydroxylase (fatty acid hydroxylase superfamily)
MLMVWQEQYGLSYSTLHMIVVVMLHNVIHLGANLVYWVFYHFEFPFIERYKSNGLEWPWKEDPEGWPSLARKSIAVLIFNSNVMVVAVYSLLDYFELNERHSTSVEDLPTSVTLALTITFFMLVEDFFFYWFHRLLHWRVIYPYIHKIHHTHSSTVGIAAEYSHPIEFIFSNMLPTSAGPAILGPNVHLITVWAWFVIRFAETLDGHCGYEFSWSPFRLIPFSGSAEYHDFHHAANIGNYGSFFSIWDSVFGTNKAFYDMKEQ